MSDNLDDTLNLPDLDTLIKILEKENTSQDQKEKNEESSSDE